MDTTAATIQITDAAAAQIRKLMTKQGISGGGLRVGIKGGGCSGLSYTFSWEKEARLGDEVVEGPGGVRVYVDQKSLIYLRGTTLEMDPALMGKGLHFINPNAKASCGCGSSFTV